VAARGAIAAGHELTARAGAAALEAGGSAVDAVVAAGVMSWAAESALTGPCGGGFVLVRPAHGRASLLDAFTAIPGRDLPRDRRLADVESVLVPVDQQTTQVFHIGSATCAVPGVVAGLHRVHRRYGRLPWRDLLLPAADTARAGVSTNAGQLRVRGDPGDPDQHPRGPRDLRAGWALRGAGRSHSPAAAGVQHRALGRAGT
jgi:gamma-glutamyltranspeptidase/glutathione hydrolase